ncbi:MAG: peptide-N-glycosidase F-related protein, partial [Salibacteraceae bacterium]
IMHYVLGCPSIGCSEWDYTTLIQLWDENNTSEKYELAKVITPYAGDKNASWHHEYKFDVTHMLPLLQGQKVLNARYDGWQDGFTISVYFEFIEGTPPRTPLQVDQVYFGGYKYGDNTQPINAALKKDTISINPTMAQSEFIMSATGHGFGNNNGNGVNPENCAEFCDKYYNLIVNNSARYQQTVWRDDCGSEPLYAQTGTWVYNRAGWCPGSESQVFKHDITDFISGSEFTMKVDWQNYTATNVNMSYNISGQVVQYGPANHTLDAEIMDVLNPSSYDRYSRYNPSANAPTIVIRNTGSTTVGAVKIKYGVSGGTFYTTTWVGNLEFMESQEVTLPIPEHNFFKGDGSNVFIAEILEVNHSVDEVASNNKFHSPFEPATFRNGVFTLTVKTNNRGYENWYLLTNAVGDTVLFRDNLANNETYIDTLDLPKQVYNFYIEDAGGDGLNWWANTAQGVGSATLRNVGISGSQPPLYVDNVEPDFGNFIFQSFSIGYHMSYGNPDYDETTWTPPLEVGIQKMDVEVAKGTFTIYPNPGNDFVNIESINFEGRTQIQIFNQVGALIYQSNMAMHNGSIETISAKDWSKGIYFITVSDNRKRETIKFVKQ